MRHVVASLIPCFMAALALAQTAPTSATVPITLDHNRIIIDVRFPMPDGSKKRVRAWVDNGNPEMFITADLAKTLSLPATSRKDGDMNVSGVQPPTEIIVGGLSVHPFDLKLARMVTGGDSIAPGMSPEISLPSTVLRHYDVVVDYLNRELTIGQLGTVHFEGDSAKATVNPETGVIAIAATVGGDKQSLALDLGASWSALSSDTFTKLGKANPSWPRMSGAVGPANMLGSERETSEELLRIPSLEFGPLTLTAVGISSVPEASITKANLRDGVRTNGFVGANALLNYRVGLDYAHSAVYFKQTSKHLSSDMDVVGLVLRPETDGRYTVAGVAEVNGISSVPEAKAGDVLVSIDGTPPTGGTMGQTWSLLGGIPGDTRTLVLERAGKQFTVQAKVYRFLSAEPAKL